MFTPRRGLAGRQEKPFEGKEMGRSSSGTRGALAMRAQTTVEYIVLFAAIAVLVLVLANLLGVLPKNSGMQIEQSKAYWSSQAGPIKVKDWSMATIKQDSPLAADANLSLVLSNPTRDTIIIKAITLAPGNFSSVMDASGNWMGTSTSLSIVLLPGEERTIVALHHGVGAGAYIPAEYYSQILTLTYSTGLGTSRETGALPLVGSNRYIVGSVGACPPPLTSCGGGACAEAGHCCGSGACNSQQTCCGGSTCCNSGSESCQSGSCVAVSGCNAPNFTCNGICCDAASYNLCQGDTQCAYCDRAKTCGEYCCGDSETCVNSGAGSYAGACQIVTPACTAPNTTCGTWCCAQGQTCVNSSAATYDGACQAAATCVSPNITCGAWCCADGLGCMNDTASTYEGACQEAMFECPEQYDICGIWCCEHGDTCDPDGLTYDQACRVDRNCTSPNSVKCGTNCCLDNQTCNETTRVCVDTKSCSDPSGWNSYNQTCVNDCDATTQYCDGTSCLCANRSLIACSSNSSDYDASTMTCIDDCDHSTQYCNGACQCAPSTNVPCNSGIGVYDSSRTCLDNCDGNTYCDGNCLCQPRPVVYCSNSPDFNAGTRICADDCNRSLYSGCAGDCTCIPLDLTRYCNAHGVFDGGSLQCLSNCSDYANAFGFDPNTLTCIDNCNSATQYCDPNTCLCDIKQPVQCANFARPFDFNNPGTYWNNMTMSCQDNCAVLGSDVQCDGSNCTCCYAEGHQCDITPNSPPPGCCGGLVCNSSGMCAPAPPVILCSNSSTPLLPVPGDPEYYDRYCQDDVAQKVGTGYACNLNGCNYYPVCGYNTTYCAEGACCYANQSCVNGACVNSCAAGTTYCNDTNGNYVGCCAAGSVCNSLKGMCVVNSTCSGANLSLCGNACCNLSSQACSGGACINCAAGMGSCGSTCCAASDCRTGGVCCPSSRWVSATNTCCEIGNVSSNGHCCPANQTYANGGCCPAGQIYSNGACCAINTWNGTMCCPSGQYAVNGTCQCSGGNLTCGSTCCNPTTQSCNEDSGTCTTCGGGQTMCGGSCCAAGNCRNGNVCCPANRWNASTNTCCPAERWNSNTNTCCPVGQVNGNGVCCQAGRWNAGTGVCCPDSKWSGSQCCPEGKTPYLGTCLCNGRITCNYECCNSTSQGDATDQVCNMTGHMNYSTGTDYYTYACVTCPAGTDKCGTSCCASGRCFGGGAACCPVNTTYFSYGATCCPNDRVVNGACCPKNKVIAGGVCCDAAYAHGDVCCLPNPYNESQYAMYYGYTNGNRWTGSTCCPYGQAYVNGSCCALDHIALTNSNLGGYAYCCDSGSWGTPGRYFGDSICCPVGTTFSWTGGNLDRADLNISNVCCPNARWVHDPHGYDICCPVGKTITNGVCECWLNRYGECVTS